MMKDKFSLVICVINLGTRIRDTYSFYQIFIVKNLERLVKRNFTAVSLSTFFSVYNLANYFF